jgi:hypothetical protein
MVFSVFRRKKDAETGPSPAFVNHWPPHRTRTWPIWCGGGESPPGKERGLPAARLRSQSAPSGRRRRPWRAPWWTGPPPTTSSAPTGLRTWRSATSATATPGTDPLSPLPDSADPCEIRCSAPKLNACLSLPALPCA